MLKADVVYNKRIQADVADVFATFSDAEMLKQWFGPKNAKMLSAVVNFKEGGAYHFLFEKANGTKFSILGSYTEIVTLKRIVFTFGYEGIPQTFGDSVVEVDFKSAGVSTEVRLVQRFSVAPHDIAGRTDTWDYMFNRLSHFVHPRGSLSNS